MHRRDLVRGLALASLVGPCLASRAMAAGYPERAVSIVNGYAPGGSTDVSARLLAQALSTELGGATAIVENRAGASGTLASEWLRRQAADGYTLMLSESSSFAIWPSMHVDGTRYKPVEDFTWISTVCTSPLVLIVSPDFPAQTLAEALAVLGSPRSESLSFSSSGAGSIPHIGAELLRHTLGPGARSPHIPYRGGAPAVLSVAKNETAWGVASLGSAAGLIEGQMVRALAVTSPVRFSQFPDVPTFIEAGVPAMELNIHYLLHAPAGLPQPIVAKLNQAAAKGILQEGLRQRFVGAGMEAWAGVNTPHAARELVEAELRRFKAIAERTGIRISG
ncbi:Bug family tripartite tricarboxylate transporter substrate binding protein [Phreatobacter stygius]|uniref:Tripartite tricarboxylate transporter substrate binding protein n=1 Tax=Phreatobacter stygius TaxID=1940610 RepID=A0A4D7AXG8_9HYPH|nr:tripartite tricarboxylate transporter substrate binding protein [Phreatobacter stygius]QCI65909.1 tripartite tricarboxylate transporter substrate binding protein [Phreatobacter stygius]